MTQGRHWEHRDCIKWRRRRKFLRVRCKNLAFYTTEPLNEPFFAEQKMKNGAAGKKNSRNIHFSKALPWFNHGSRRGKNAGEKIESALIWGRHLQKGLVKSVGFFFFFFFFTWYSLSSLQRCRGSVAALFCSIQSKPGTVSQLVPFFTSRTCGLPFYGGHLPVCHTGFTDSTPPPQGVAASLRTLA